jgi:cytochrome c553
MTHLYFGNFKYLYQFITKRILRGIKNYNMRKIVKITAALTSVLFFAAISGLPVSAQSSQKTDSNKKAISPEVLAIVQKSCVKCHINEGMGGLKLSEWDSYTPAKQAAKAKAMCDKVSDKIMPPKRFIENNPGAAPTDADIKTICDWSASLQPAKK